MIKISFLIISLTITLLFSQENYVGNDSSKISTDIILVNSINDTIDTIAKKNDTNITKTDIKKRLAPTKKIRILFCQPVSSYNTLELKNVWLLKMCETAVYLRLGAIDAIQMVSRDTVATLLPDYSSYRKATPFKEYVRIAKMLDVDYVVYTQVEYSHFINEGQFKLSENVNLFAKVFSPNCDTPHVVFAEVIPFRKIGFKIDEFLFDMIKKLEIPTTEMNLAFLKTPIFTKRERNIRKLGTFITMADESPSLNWTEFITSFKKFMAKEENFLIGYKLGMRIGEEFDQYKDAAYFAHALLDIIDIVYPQMVLETGRLYRLAGNFNQSQNLIDATPKLPHLHDNILMERAFLLKHQGETEAAMDIAIKVLEHDYYNKLAREFFRHLNKK